MKLFYCVCYAFLNKINVPYRFSKLELKYRRIKNTFAKHLFLSIGRQTNIRPNTKISYKNKVSIGDRSSIGDSSFLVAAAGITIGKDVMMGPNVTILTQNHEITSMSKKLIAGEILKKKVIIEDDVWIGMNAIILPGAYIKKGIVIAAGSVVTGKTYPAYSVIGGNPAKVIRFREEE